MINALFATFQYIQRDYMTLVEVLEPQISVKTKDEIASTMVNILQKLGKAPDFLSDIVMAEVDRLGEWAKMINYKLYAQKSDDL